MSIYSGNFLTLFRVSRGFPPNFSFVLAGPILLDPHDDVLFFQDLPAPGCHDWSSRALILEMKGKGSSSWQTGFLPCFPIYKGHVFFPFAKM